MATRNAHATWHGTLREGNGVMKLGSGRYEGPFTWASRFEDAEGTNPEELLGAAHAGCFSMSLSSQLTRDGHAPEVIETTATVHLGRVDGAATITLIELQCQARVPGLDAEAFAGYAERAKAGCPVSKALAGVEIQLQATLLD